MVTPLPVPLTDVTSLNFSNYVVALSATLQLLHVNGSGSSAVYLAINVTGWRAASFIRYRGFYETNYTETYPPSTNFQNDHRRRRSRGLAAVPGRPLRL